MTSLQLKSYLEHKVKEYNSVTFIENDPISVPHEYKKLQDIEIVAFWTAMLSWGQRVTIIKKSRELFALMDNAPFQFITTHQQVDLLRFKGFVHRTFNETDTLHFIRVLKAHYKNFHSLETAFTHGMSLLDKTVERGLEYFHNYFFNMEFSPNRTRKHISTPVKNSACKRLNMFLRWMVRKDESGVDFGLWNNIKPGQLIAPCDVHVDRVARRLGLISRKQRDWRTAMELTDAYRQFDPMDPVKYDFALFGIGLEDKF